MCRPASVGQMHHTQNLLIEAVTGQPDRIDNWHRLYEARPTDDSIAAYVQQLEERLPNTGRYSRLRSSLLYLLDHQSRHLHELQLHLEPVCPDYLEQLTIFRILVQTHLVNQFQTHVAADHFLADLGIAALMKNSARWIRERAPRQGLRSTKQTDAGKVLILSTELSLLSHPASRMAWDHARILKSHGYQVRVMSARETSCADMGVQCGALAPHLLADRCKQEWYDTLGHDVKVWVGDPRRSPLQRWIEMLQRLAEYDPDVVLYIGTESPAQYLLEPHYPMITLQTIGVPMHGPADIQLLSRPEVWPVGQAGLAYSHRANVSHQEVAADLLSDKQLRCPPGKIKLLTAGMRLTPLIKGDWAERMKVFLRIHPQLHWIIVGQTDLPPVLVDVADRISLFPYQTRLGSFMKSCDVYVNPDRLGGGLSVAMAMACATATVSMSNTDGGDKLGEFACNDAASYLALLERLIGSQGERIEFGHKLRQCYLTELDMAGAAPKLERAIALAKERFRRRTERKVMT